MEALLEQEIVGEPSFVTLADKKAYRLAYDMRAVIAYKQKTGEILFKLETLDKIFFGGKPADPKAEQRAIDPDPERLMACLWAGLRSHHADVSEDQVLGLVDLANMLSVTTAVLAAIGSYFPKREADPNVPAPAPPPANKKMAYLEE